MSTAESRALMVSVWASVAFAGVSLVWGLALGSLTVIFDGLYSCAGVVLSLFAVWALRTSRRGPDERYPWGREAWEPLAVVVKALALAGLCLYALAGAVADLLAGGRDVDAGWGLAYAVVATAGGVAVSLYLRARARSSASNLLRAESAEWTGDTVLSVGVLLGFGLALVLQATGRADLSRFVDPGMVAVISAVFLRVPIRLVTGGLGEMLSLAPDEATMAQLRSRVDEVADRYGFTGSVLRAAKVGSRLDVEIDFLVGDASAAQHVRELDVARRDLYDRLEPLGYGRSLVVTFTADRFWLT